jgi:Fe-Mn family superoxide dismutase
VTIGLPELPYAYDALVPAISEATLRTHHGKHHRGYVEKLNALVQGTNLVDSALDAIVQQSAARHVADPAMSATFNNAAQAWNHAFYWRSLRPKGGRGPQGALADRIVADFNSYADFAASFKSAATAHFGSGWAWLVLDQGILKIVTTPNADTPIVRGQMPLLVIDVWEHAYYLDYQERRAAYVAGVVDSLLNWEFAESNVERSGIWSDDVIDVSGNRFGTAAIERALVSHPAVAEAAVVGYPHPVKGHGIHAYVRLRTDARPSSALRRELEQRVRAKIGPIAVPDIIQWAFMLPKTRVGVLARSILRKIAAKADLNPADTSSLADSSVINDLVRGRSDVATTAE